MSPFNENVIVVGSGLSALLTANYLSEHMNVIIFTKSTKHDNNSSLAQGGVACSVAETDSWKLHFNDTLLAGCYHNNEQAVEVLTKQGPQLLQEIMAAGMEFDKNENGSLSLGMEGAHTERRILHAGGDQTGKELMHWLQTRLSASVKMVEHETVIKLFVEDGRCRGVQTFNQNGEKRTYFAAHVVLATGGAGALYAYTSNNDTVTGMAMSLAYQAGAVLTDLEFMQFHPTMLSVKGRAVGLISEAVRGEGAYLVNEDGERFMKDVHPLMDLAPRDVVSRAIFQEMAAGKRVFLNIEKVPKFLKRFPSISSMCQKHGISIDKNLLPVVPGAHFFMGGIQTNLQGETSIPGLYAVGEASCNGVHGANRLASNSLLEGIVFSKVLADHIRSFQPSKSLYLPSNNNRTIVEKPKQIEMNKKMLPSKAVIQIRMMKHAGIVRHEKGLKELLTWLAAYKCYWDNPDKFVDSFTYEEIEIIHMLHLSYLIGLSALERKESRGAHYRLEYPTLREEWNRNRITHRKKVKLHV